MTTPEQRALVETVRAFARDKITPAVQAPGGELSRARFFELMTAAAPLGLPGLLIDPCYGGGGGTHLDNALVAEELGAVNAGLASALNLTMTVPALVAEAGTAEQRERWLPPAAVGTHVLAGALNEPSVAGSELFNPRPDAGKTLATTRAPETARIGPEGQALRLLMTSTPGMAVGLAAVFTGVARTAFEQALAYTSRRHSWGRPIREHQAVALQLAEMAIEVRAARLLVHDAARALDAGAPPDELAVAVPAAKTRAVDAAISCAQRAVRLHGAAGVTEGSGPEKLLRDAWTGYSCDFTREMLHLAIAAAL